MAERGVLVVPDVLSSAGAVIEGVLTVQGQGSASTPEAVAAAIGRIERSVTEVLSEALARGKTPGAVAVERAERALA